MSTAAALTTTQTDHLVQFYTTDDELVDAVARHVFDGGSGVAVIVATEIHRRAIEHRLAELREANAVSAAAADSMVMLDADATLRRFFDGRRIDPVGFDDVIGTLLRALPAGRPRRVYGEMVAILWDAGQVTAALELERLWNNLGETLSFALMCGYPRHSTLAGDDAIGRVCDAHSGVLGRPSAAQHAEAQRTFGRALSTPAEVRQFVRSTLTEWNADEERVDDLVLVADELVTNALVHAASDVGVTLTSTAEAIRIAVVDRSSVEPRPANRGTESRSGRGLHIVDMLSSAWGHQRTGVGKVVWARFDS